MMVAVWKAVQRDVKVAFKSWSQFADPRGWLLCENSFAETYQYSKRDVLESWPHRGWSSVLFARRAYPGWVSFE